MTLSIYRMSLVTLPVIVTLGMAYDPCVHAGRDCLPFPVPFALAYRASTLLAEPSVPSRPTTVVTPASMIFDSVALRCAGIEARLAAAANQVNMRVDEARHDQLTCSIHDLKVR